MLVKQWWIVHILMVGISPIYDKYSNQNLRIIHVLCLYIYIYICVYTWDIYVPDLYQIISVCTGTCEEFDQKTVWWFRGFWFLSSKQPSDNQTWLDYPQTEWSFKLGKSSTNGESSIARGLHCRRVLFW